MKKAILIVALSVLSVILAFIVLAVLGMSDGGGSPDKPPSKATIEVKKLYEGQYRIRWSAENASSYDVTECHYNEHGNVVTTKMLKKQTMQTSMFYSVPEVLKDETVKIEVYGINPNGSGEKAKANVLKLDKRIPESHKNGIFGEVAKLIGKVKTLSLVFAERRNLCLKGLFT